MVAHRPACRRGNRNLVSWRRPAAKASPVGGGGPRARLFRLVLTFILACAAPALAHAQAFKATVTAEVSGGYARLVFSLNDEIDARAHIAGNVLIVAFDRPISISVDRLPEQLSDYIGAARRDPDGRAIRIALAQKLTLNAIVAADKFFVDLLPETWSGPPPGLPKDVVEELARRAREVERLERQARMVEEQKKLVPVPVRVAEQPTFTRYVFDIPDKTSVSADRGKDRLTLTFDAPFAFDLADAEAALPPTVASIHSEAEQDSTLVRFSFLSPVDLRTFRDGKSYVVDLVKNEDALPARDKPAANPLPIGAGLETGPSIKPGAENAPSSAAVPPSPDSRMAAVAVPAAVAQQNPPTAAPLAAPAALPASPKAPEPKSSESMPPQSIASESRAPEPRPSAPAPAGPAQPAAPVAMGGAAAQPVPPPTTLAKTAPAPSAPTQAAPTPPASAQTAPAKAAPAPAAPAITAPPQIAPAQTKPAQAAPAASSGPVAPAAAANADAPPVAAKAPTPSLLTPSLPSPSAPSPSAPSPSAPSPSAPSPSAPSPSAPPPAASPVPTPHENRAGDTLPVELSRQGANLKVTFPFLTPTAAAVFHRADTLWIVFDSTSTIDLAALAGEASRTIRGAEFSRDGDAGVVRLRLDHPHLASIATDGAGWSLVIGDTVDDPTHALDITRNLIGPTRASVTVAFDHPHRLHRLRDPEVGDDLLVVTGFAPARGFINEQDFVEFHALASTQGVVIEPLADDLHVELAADKVVIGRPGGLTLSASLQSVLHASALRPVTFDAQVWGLDRQAIYGERQSELIAAAAAAAAAPNKRTSQRLDLARFYIARDMYPEAKGVLDVVLGEHRPAGEDVTASVLRAVAEVMMQRPDAALKDLANPAIGDQHDAPLWRALAYAGQGKWALARDSFKRVEAAVATLPVELQRVALKTEMRAAIEVGDFAGAADELNDLETIGLPRELQPAISVLVGRLSEGMGHNEEALTAYRTAADSWDRPAAAQGRLREAALRYALGDLKRGDILSELETLTTIWRGDETEVGALEIMARLYTEEGRYRDSFYVMRNAVAAHPDSDMTHRIQNAAAATFNALFLAGKGDALSAIDALALFYDFRELTPIGRRGDEMIRRLADRLVAVDLLDQAADLLQYQVDHRLQGAARAQVAIRLAVIYLMNRKPDRALATLRGSRTADLASELRDQRLLLEARAMSDLGRYDLALEVIANIEGREAIRLRSDILWAARRWAQAAEQIELYYGERWKEWEPLNEVERADILRAAVGYALGEDALGLGRLHERYTAKMTETPDARAFAVVSAPLGTSGAEFRNIARAAASVDTLEGFLHDLQSRYPDTNPTAPPASPSPLPAGSSAHALPPPAAAPARAGGKTAQR
jgi:tetratricopeptide (TPR) repeat protein